MSNGVDSRKLAIDLRQQLTATEKERDTLRAQLVERDALLTAALKELKHHERSSFCSVEMENNRLIPQIAYALSTASPATINQQGEE